MLAPHLQQQEALLSRSQLSYRLSDSLGARPAPYVPLSSLLSSQQPQPSVSVSVAAAPGERVDECGCRSSVVLWSGSVALQWLSFILLLAAVSTPTWYAPQVSRRGDEVGLWESCWLGQCEVLSNQTSSGSSAAAVFQALRVFALLSLALTCASAILSSIRLSRHVRRLAISARLERVGAVVGLCSAASLLVAFTLASQACDQLNEATRYNRWTWAAGVFLLMAAFIFILLAVACYATALTLHKSAARVPVNAWLDGSADDNNNAQLLEQPPALAAEASVEGVEVSAPLGYSSAFQHPAPSHSAQYALQPAYPPIGYHAPAVPPAALAPQW